MDHFHEDVAITASNFEDQLLPLLEKIAEADFIAIDLETSGTKESLAADLRVKTMEQVYEIISTNASSFGALQMGLTMARWEKGRYKTCTATIPISPLVSTRTAEQRELANVTDRRAGISQLALRRIVDSELNVADELKDSIPYLSRQEIRTLRGWPLVRLSDEGSVPCTHSVDKTAEDTISTQIEQWYRADHDRSVVPLQIYEPRGGSLHKSTIETVKRLLSSKFSDYTLRWTQTAHCITVLEIWTSVPVSSEDTAVAEQGGLLYLAESLMSDCKIGDYCLLQERVPQKLSQSMRLDELKDEDIQAPEQKSLAKILQSLKFSQAQLVGHHIIHDLCFMYAMFVGPLSYSLYRLAGVVHSLWPRVIDIAVLGDPMADFDHLSASLGGPSHTEAGITGRNTISENGAGGNRLIGDYDAGRKSYMVMTTFLKLGANMLESTSSQISCHHDTCGSIIKDSEVESAKPIQKLDHHLWTPFLNRVRVANAGVLDLKPLSIEGWVEASEEEEHQGSAGSEHWEETSSNGVSDGCQAERWGYCTCAACLHVQADKPVEADNAVYDDWPEPHERWD